MSVIDGQILDLGGPFVYVRVVEASAHNEPTAPTASTGYARKRRRPPSLSEQQRRTARIRPWAEHWKQLKAAGQWR